MKPTPATEAYHIMQTVGSVIYCLLFIVALTVLIYELVTLHNDRKMEKENVRRKQSYKTP